MSTVNREMYKKANMMLSYKADRSKKREVVTDERISSQKQQKKMNQNGYGLPSQSKTPKKKSFIASCQTCRGHANSGAYSDQA